MIWLVPPLVFGLISMGSAATGKCCDLLTLDYNPELPRGECSTALAVVKVPEGIPSDLELLIYTHEYAIMRSALNLSPGTHPIPFHYCASSPGYLAGVLVQRDSGSVLDWKWGDLRVLPEGIKPLSPYIEQRPAGTASASYTGLEITPLPWPGRYVYFDLYDPNLGGICLEVRVRERELDIIPNGWDVVPGEFLSGVFHWEISWYYGEPTPRGCTKVGEPDIYSCTNQWSFDGYKLRVTAKIKWSPFKLLEFKPEIDYPQSALKWRDEIKVSKCAAIEPYITGTTPFTMEFPYQQINISGSVSKEARVGSLVKFPFTISIQDDHLGITDSISATAQTCVKLPCEDIWEFTTPRGYWIGITFFIMKTDFDYNVREYRIEIRRPSPRIVVQSIECPSSVYPGQEFSITATFNNTGGLRGSSKYYLNNTQIGWTPELQPSQTWSASIPVKAPMAEAQILYRVTTEHDPTGKTCSVTVSPAPSFFDIEWIRANDRGCPITIAVGETVRISGSVRNTGQLPGTKDVVLYRDGLRVGSTSVSLGPMESKVVEFTDAPPENTHTYILQTPEDKLACQVRAAPPPFPMWVLILIPGAVALGVVALRRIRR